MVFFALNPKGLFVGHLRGFRRGLLGTLRFWSFGSSLEFRDLGRLVFGLFELYVHSNVGCFGILHTSMYAHIRRQKTVHKHNIHVCISLYIHTCIHVYIYIYIYIYFFSF